MKCVIYNKPFIFIACMSISLMHAVAQQKPSDSLEIDISGPKMDIASAL